MLFIISGCFTLSSPDQIDGWIPGAIAIANMLLSLGKTVTLITDSRFLEMTKAIVDEAVNMGRIRDLN